MQQPDGKIVTAGYATSASRDLAVARYGTDGVLDPTFGGSGLVVTPLGPGLDYADGVLLQPDGRILVGGGARIGSTLTYNAVRYLTNGALDGSFGTGGIATSNPVGSRGYLGEGGMVLQADGKVVIGGSIAQAGGPARMGMVRFTSAGMIDASFGSGGLVVLGAGTQRNFTFDLIGGPDGQLTLVGSSNGADNSMVLTRLEPGGGVPDFAGGSADWTAAPGGTFGACLRAVGAGATTDSSTWSATGSCTASNLDPWRAVGTSASPNIKIAASTVAGTQVATASLRFGFRPAPNQAPGAYVAPIVFEAIAPNA